MNTPLRCKCCNKLLGHGCVITLSIKCPRCKTINTLSATEHPTHERHRAPQHAGAHHGEHYPNAG